MEDNNAYEMTEKGWKTAMDIWRRFAMNGEDIDVIAASHGLNRAEVELVMAMAFSGGNVTFGD